VAVLREGALLISALGPSAKLRNASLKSAHRRDRRPFVTALPGPIVTMSINQVRLILWAVTFALWLGCVFAAVTWARDINVSARVQARESGRLGKVGDLDKANAGLIN
jgi:hypothetical protein